MSNKSLIVKALLFYGCKFPNHRGKWWIHAQLRKLLGVTVDEEVDVVRKGLRWSLRPSDYTQSELFWLGARDRWDSYHTKRILKPGSVVFDIGANFGYYSIMLASHLKGECKIYSFEPNPTTYQRLLKNVSLNNFDPTIKPQCIGFSDTSGYAYIIEKDGNSGSARVSEQKEGPQITLTTLDKFCTTHSPARIDFIKVDIEGFEERLLRAGQETIMRFRPVIMIELNPSVLKEAGTSLKDVVDILNKYDYTFFKAQRDKMVPLANLSLGQEHINAFCFPKEKTFN